MCWYCGRTAALRSVSSELVLMRALEISENRRTVLTVHRVFQLFPEKSHLSFNLAIILPADLRLQWGKKLSKQVRSCLAGRAAVVLLYRPGRTNLMMVEGLQKTRSVALDGPWRSWYTVQSTQPIPLRLFSSAMARHFFFSTFKLLITCLPWRAITASLSLTDTQYLYESRRLARSQTPGAEPPPPHRR